MARIITGRPAVVAAATGFTPNTALGWSASAPSGVANGNAMTFTKSGGGLGLRADERPGLWIPGEVNMNTSAVSRIVTGNLTPQTGAAIQTSIKPNNAVGAIGQTFPIPGNDTNYFSDTPMFPNTSGATYLSIKRYVAFDVSPQNYKKFRGWSNNGVGSTPDGYISCISGLGGSANLEAVAGTPPGDDSNAIVSTGSRAWSPNYVQNTWRTEEHLWVESTIDTFDGLFQHWISGALAYASSTRWKWLFSTGSPGANLNLTKWFSEQLSNWTGPSGIQMLACHIYWTDTASVLYFSDEATNTTTIMNGSNDPGFTREVQLLGSTGNSSTTFSVPAIDKRSFSALSGIKVYCNYGTTMGEYVGVFT